MQTFPLNSVKLPPDRGANAVLRRFVAPTDLGAVHVDRSGDPAGQERMVVLGTRLIQHDAIAELGTDFTDPLGLEATGLTELVVEEVNDDLSHDRRERVATLEEPRGHRIVGERLPQ